MVKRILLILQACTISLALTGCGAALEHWENENNFMVSANDLDLTLQSDPQFKSYAPKYTDITTLKGDDLKEYLGFVIGDSQFKCSKFLNGLVLAENTSNVSLDVMTTIFSALGTAFTPVSTIHAMTAGATITSGSKTAIDSDIYAKATIGNYAQAIQAAYYSKMENYKEALSNSDPSKLIATIEVEKIRSIHKECSLASAQSTISATLQAASPSQGGGTTTDTWIVSKSVKTGDTFTLKAIQKDGTTIPIVFKARTDKPEDLADDIAGTINTNSAMKNANIAATKENDGLTIDLQSPATAGVTWSADPATDFQRKGKPATLPGAQGQPSPATSSGVLTKGAVPGSSLTKP